MMGCRLPALLLDAVLVGVALVDVWVHIDSDEPVRLGLALGAAFVLLLRRRMPLLTFVLTLPAVLVSSAVFASLAALYSLATFTRRRVALAVCVAVFTICDMTTWPSGLDPPSASLELTYPSTLITVGYTGAAAAAAVFLGQLVQTRRALSLRLAEISAARENERTLTAEKVLAKERAQLAREMHDVVSHQVSLIAVRAGALQVSTRDTVVKDAAATIRRLSVQTLDELRHMVSVLRASGGRPAELTPQPSLDDLQRLVDTSGIDTQLQSDAPDGLPPAVQRTVYRTVQEALTNVRKHAPGATATVRVCREDGVILATVTNTPSTQPGLALPGAHHGLVGLHQRAALLGGTVTSGPTADGGYELRLELPTSTPGSSDAGQ
ncbi:sensor histidine kinase [Streptomyces sp. NPDC096176]|uniref:sensor histidine kinase n=1 Tax=Streptomyces sp. NPDC096176 TaxID=3366079 RepID=UPI003823C3F3